MFVNMLVLYYILSARVHSYNINLFRLVRIFKITIEFAGQVIIFANFSRYFRGGVEPPKPLAAFAPG